MINPLSMLALYTLNEMCSSNLYIGSIYFPLSTLVFCAEVIILLLASTGAGDVGYTMVLTLCLQCIYARFLKDRRSS